VARGHSSSAKAAIGGTRATALALTLAAGLLVAGCGGGDKGDESTLPAQLSTSSVPQTLTKQEYVARGDQICAAGTFKIGDQARQQFGNVPPTQAQVQQFSVDVVVPTFEDQLDQLRALPAPAGDEQQVTAIYDAVQEGVDALQANPALFATPNGGGALVKASRLARAYGFKQCGQS
jgi:hypothetical protein